MIAIREAIIVEGKYDKMRISALFDTAVIETGGFRIFGDKEKRAVIRGLAKARGIVVLTDSDGAGFVIRNHLKGIVGAGKLYQAYIPEIQGKERRKDAPSKEGLLGVEGMTDEIIVDAVLKSGVHVESGSIQSNSKLTKLDFYTMGLTGRDNSAYLRKALLEKLGFPHYMTTGAMISALSLIYTKEQLKKMTEELQENINQKSREVEDDEKAEG
ncbi:MAG: DUF4093 domain-containing protein [Clostridia bacterium]|nr:DUF4093 domain-containing protein [Clostridia bacterium]